jgi:hypothetical protein
MHPFCLCNRLLFGIPFAILLAGATLTVMSALLSLGANQAKKVVKKSSLECGPVTAIYLDEIKDPAMQQDFLENIVSLPSDISKTILLFMSPQALKNHSFWQFLVKELITRGLLRFVDADDIHLFLHFGMACCLKFSSLEELLFQHLLADGPQLVNYINFFS